MCGIYGCLSFGERGDHPEMEVHRSLVKMLERRGPDDEGIWSDPAICTLGFRRLSILDLSAAGSQPMLTADGRYSIVFNGEMYNFPELKKQLQSEVSYFRSSGDSEVLLYALAKWGISALDQLNGMYAFAFYDRLEKRLLLVRDHAGIKPLYYMVTSEGVVFSSQYDVLMRHPWCRNLAVCSEALALYLNLGYIPAPYAILRNTFMLKPGCWIEFKANGDHKEGRFFDYPVYQEPDLRGEEAYEAVDAAVTAAVKRHLISDVPVGTFLSGGIDSPLVAAKMQSLSHAPVRAFTIGTNGDAMDESPDAIIYARELGMEHVVEHVAPRQALVMLDDVISACGEPFGDYSIIPTMMVSRLARREVKVMLSGDGGDELFWGYANRMGSVLEKSRGFRHPRWFRTARWGLKKYLNLGGGNFNYRWPDVGSWYRIRHSRLNEEWVSDIFPDLAAVKPDFQLFDYDGWEMKETAQWLRWNEFVGHLTMVLLKVDRASMYHSLEVRVPLLDRELVQLSKRIDWRSCINLKTRIGKIPLRKALERHLKHQTHVKRGFSVPMNAWMRGPLKPVFHEAIYDRKEILGMAIDHKAVRRIQRLHFYEDFDLGWGLWTLLSLSLWEQRFIKNSSLAIQRPV